MPGSKTSCEGKLGLAFIHPLQLFSMRPASMHIVYISHHNHILIYVSHFSRRWLKIKDQGTLMIRSSGIKDSFLEYPYEGFVQEGFVCYKRASTKEPQLEFASSFCTSYVIFKARNSEFPPQ